MNEKDAQQVAVKMLTLLSNKNSGEDDRVFRNNTKDEIEKRDGKYTELLNHFVTLTRIRNYCKELFKWSFLILVIILVFMLGRIVSKIFNKYMSLDEIDKIVDSIPLLITSLVGFVSTIIAIPITITKYLFSTKEDKNITNLILHTQVHDTGARDWLSTSKNEESKNNDLTKRNEDNKKTG